MLQPRLNPWRSLCNCRCFHTFPRHFRSVEIQASVESKAVTDQQANLQSKSTSVSEQGSIAILRTYKPRTPGLRHLKRPINDHLYKGRVYLPLTIPRRGQHIGGRNSQTGRITVRHRGGGHKRRIRMIDFERKEPGKHLVERIEHDPGRSAHIALLSRKEDDKTYYSYIVAEETMRAGDEIESFMAGIPDRIIREVGGTKDPGMLAARISSKGNCLPLHMVSAGTVVYNVGLRPGKGAQLCRSAGTYATVINKREPIPGKARYVDVKLKSGEIRRIQEECCATIGIASNVNYNRRSLGKAGRKRWLGIRPTVRGVAMNAADHPHGGGRGKSKGNRDPVSPWGQPTKSGYKTRSRKKVNKYVVVRRSRPSDRKVANTKKKDT